MALDTLTVASCALYDADANSLALQPAVLDDGETLSLVTQEAPDAPVSSCEVVFSHTFAYDERILLNGYQSWTDTVERGILSIMRGLRGVPRAIVDSYVLDGGGDYRFSQYSLRPGVLHGFTYATLRSPSSGEVLLVGSLDDNDGFTSIEIDTLASTVRMRKECGRTAEPSRPLLRLCIVRGNSFDEVYDRWFTLMGVRALPALPLVGYTSWYRHYDDIDEANLSHDLEALAHMFDELGLTGDAESGYRRMFQIDDGYCRVGDWLYVDSGKFPSGLGSLSGRIRDAGFVPGLWVSPFVCERMSNLAQDHPAWLLRDESGEVVTTGSHWSGGLALDTQNPEVRAYVTDVLSTVTNNWGYQLLKCDFLFAACMLPHAGLNRGELMADGIDLIRQAVGPDVAILACGVPLGSLFGKVEYCRIGCDVTPNWDDKPYMRFLHRERTSTKNSLGNTRGRAPLDGRAFACDPDVVYLRSDVGLSATRRKELLDTNSSLGSALLTSDDVSLWGRAEREMFVQAVETMVGRRR